MAREDGNAAVLVERFFQFALLGLVASGFLAIAGSGYLDRPTMVLVAAGLALRGLTVAGAARLEISEHTAAAATAAYAGFFLLDLLALSHDLLAAAVHLAFFLAVARTLTAQTQPRLSLPRGHRLTWNCWRPRCCPSISASSFGWPYSSSSPWRR